MKILVHFYAAALTGPFMREGEHLYLIDIFAGYYRSLSFNKIGSAATPIHVHASPPGSSF
jgi:hypothetical protein